MIEQVLLFEAISKTPCSIDHERSVIDFDIYIIIFPCSPQISQPQVGIYSILIQSNGDLVGRTAEPMVTLPGYPSKSRD